MGRMFDAKTLLTMGSALAVAIIAIFFYKIFGFLGALAGRGLYIGDTLFHEMGHAIFGWLFGRPAIPSILTLFSADKAGGITVPIFHHSWTLQGMIWLGLGYGCFQLRQYRPALFWPATALLWLFIILAFTRYPELIISYMGHGSAILCGGVLLYRAWLNIIVKTWHERWFNALFGFYIVLNNADFAYKLLYVPAFKMKYENEELTMDFTNMTDMMPHWRIGGIALFTLVYALLTLILSFALAVYFYEDEHYDEEPDARAPSNPPMPITPFTPPSNPTINAGHDAGPTPLDKTDAPTW